MIKEAIVLAGGFGTRLKGVITDIPKPMAPVAGKPFLEFLLLQLLSQGISRVILSVGYKYEIIKEYFGDNFKGLNIDYAIEDEPLGTGGAISHALKKVSSDHVLVLNGDSFIDVDLDDFSSFCRKEKSDLGIVLKEMFDFERYGTVSLQGKRIIRFNEKKAVKRGLINCGVYYFKKTFLDRFAFPDQYSFESDFIEVYAPNSNFIGYLNDGYFIDIGIPEDYSKAQKELPALLR